MLKGQAVFGPCQGDHITPWMYYVSGAVLVSPTDNGVLNQIPAGDSRESSREQVVPDDGALFLQAVSLRVGDHTL